MNQICKTTAVTFAGLAVATHAFAPTTPTVRSGLKRPLTNQIGSGFSQQTLHHHRTHRPSVRLYNTENDDAQDNEILRLKEMAARLRSEAAALEAEKASQLAVAAEKAFRKFDINSDGEISTSELKAGLEKMLKTEISEKRARELMDVFDTTGDGTLKLGEFVTVDRFRNQLEGLAREEKRLAAEADVDAKLKEQQALFAEAKLEFLNEKTPTSTDKVISVIPYLFPLMDGLLYGRFLLGTDDALANPIVIALGALYALYRSIPFSGFAAFFALNTFSGNPSLNRLVRFNMQQAIFIDIALFFPSLIVGVGGLVLGKVGSPVTDLTGEIFSDVIFGTLILILTYCVGSSLLGKEPDSIPLISQNVKDRMPTLDMFDDEGKFVPRELRDGEDKKTDDK